MPQQGIRIRPASVARIVHISVEIEATAETAGVGSVRRPVHLQVNSKFHGMRSMNPAEIVSEMEAIVALIVGQPVFGVQVGSIGDSSEVSLRKDIVWVSRRKQLSSFKGIRDPAYWVEVVFSRSTKKIFWLTLLFLAREAAVELVDLGRTNYTRPSHDHAVGDVSVMVLPQGQVGAISQYAASVRSRVRPPAPGQKGEVVLIRRIVIDLQGVQHFGNFTAVLPLEVVIPPC